jgi:hypothetical protein
MIKTPAPALALKLSLKNNYQFRERAGLSLGARAGI